VVGFVLVFAVITTTVGVVSVFGFGGLENSRNVAQLDNTERAFDVLDDNLADIYREGAPSRATEVKLADAELAMGESEEVALVVPNGPSPTETFRPVVYRSVGRDASLVYEAGAVIRVEEGGAVMVNEPPMRFDETRTILTLVQTTEGDARSISGETTVLVRARETGSKVLHPEGVSEPDLTVGAGDTLTFRFETTPTRAPAWERYFESKIDWTGDDECDVSPGTGRVVCTLEGSEVMEELYVTKSTIEVTFE
jgi:hypothetical protein